MEKRDRKTKLKENERHKKSVETTKQWVSFPFLS